MGALPNRCIYPLNALKGHLISTTAPAPGQDPEARIFLAKFTPRREETSVLIPLV